MYNMTYLLHCLQIKCYCITLVKCIINPTAVFNMQGNYCSDFKFYPMNEFGDKIAIMACYMFRAFLTKHYNDLLKLYHTKNKEVCCFYIALLHAVAISLFFLLSCYILTGFYPYNIIDGQNEIVVVCAMKSFGYSIK